MAERRPYVNKLVPTHQVDWLLGRIHVGTSDAEIETEIRDRIPKGDARWTTAIVDQTVRYAIWRHHRNRDEYRRVMSGRY